MTRMFVGSRYSTRSRFRTGFTLIELLVVVAIIALLVAILLPSLARAREQAKNAACMSHIKNIATSSRVYEADDPNGWGIPVHPMQYDQANTGNTPIFIGAYEFGGKSGIGRPQYGGGGQTGVLGSKYGTYAGFGPSTRPMNDILYKGGFKDNLLVNDPDGALDDTKLDLDLFKCPGDDGPPRGAHCPDWLANTERSSYDHFGNSYAANLFMTGSTGGGCMSSNSPYLRPVSRIPTPARTIYFEENIGRWAWAARRETCPISGLDGVDIGPTKSIASWHGNDWEFNRSFVDAHAEKQKILVEGTGDAEGFFEHNRPEHLSSYPPFSPAVACPCIPPCTPNEAPGTFDIFQCIIIRGDGWAKDTMPNAPILTELATPASSSRPSYEDCVCVQMPC